MASGMPEGASEWWVRECDIDEIDSFCRGPRGRCNQPEVNQACTAVCRALHGVCAMLRAAALQKPLRQAMPCYAMPCHAMLMLCYAVLCYAMLCYAVLCHAMPCYAMLFGAPPVHAGTALTT